MANDTLLFKFYIKNCFSGLLSKGKRLSEAKELQLRQTAEFSSLTYSS